MPCDSFALRCLWDRGLEGGLADLVGFTAWEDGQRVFQGVVDECECRFGDSGSTLTVSGRGMAALLLDNEAQAADYQTATAADILRDHVEPYGIQVAGGYRLPPVEGFSVASGSSEWQVLYDFARYHGGVAPRFDRQGRLVLSPWQDLSLIHIFWSSARIPRPKPPWFGCKKRRMRVWHTVMTI